MTPEINFLPQNHSFSTQDKHKRANCLTMSGAPKPGVKGHTELIIKVLKLTCANKTVKVQGYGIQSDYASKR